MEKQKYTTKYKRVEECIEVRYSPSQKCLTYRVRVRGRIDRTGTYYTLKDARCARDKWIREQQAVKYRRIAHVERVSEVINSFLTDGLHGDRSPAYERGLRQRLGWWETRMRRVRVNDTGAVRQAINLAKTSLRNLQRSGCTINRYVAAIQVAFSWAYKVALIIDSNPTARMQKEKEAHREPSLTNEQIARLLYFCRLSVNVALYLIVRIALTTGARKNEIVGLRWCEVDFSKSRLQLLRTKNGKPRSVDLPHQVTHELKIQFAQAVNKNPDALVFPGKGPLRHNYSEHNGELRTNRGEPTIMDFKRAWRTACKLAGLDTLRFHDLRHCFASKAIESGAPEVQVQRTLGHSSASMTKRYTHLSEESYNPVVALMSKAMEEIDELREKKEEDEKLRVKDLAAA